MTDPGHYANGTQDFTAQISRFKAEQVDVLAGLPIPPDFTTFWKQAAQQGFRPRIATIGKALLFPSTIDALGDLGQNLGTEVRWSPAHPYTSSLTGQTAKQLADAYTAQTSKPGPSRSASYTRCSRWPSRSSLRPMTRPGWPRHCPG
jgi:branched-chain amino acid transport system substrate-binding protein